jgi:hypothetical protein
VNVTVIVSPATATSAAVLLDDIETTLSVGAVRSTAMLLESVVSVTCTNALPAASAPSIVKLTAPAVSPALTVYTHVQPVPAPEDVSVTTTSAPVVATPPVCSTHAGSAAMGSLDVNVSVIVSPDPAPFGDRLFDAMRTSVSVGGTLSNTIALPSLTLDT